MASPLLDLSGDNAMEVDAKVSRIARKVRAVMEELGLDLSDPHLVGTDLRVARAYRELFAGLAPGAEPVLRSFPNTEQYSAMVTVTDIPFYSVCAHHFLPFFGSAHVAYLPGKQLLGLSKLSRVVDFYARRPQVQERLTRQIVDLIERRLRPVGVMVVVQARHFCIEMRGVSRAGMITTTSAMGGAFSEELHRREFLALLPREAGGVTGIVHGREQ
jgi:GTP cyclohydrolase IA